MKAFLLALFAAPILTFAHAGEMCDYVIKPTAITLNHQFDTQTQDDDVNELYLQLGSIGQFYSKSNRGISQRNIKKSEVGKEMSLCPGGAGSKCGSITLKDQLEEYAQFSFKVWERDDPWYYVSASDYTMVTVDPVAVGTLPYQNVSTDADIAANRRVYRATYESTSYWVNLKFSIERTCDCNRN